MDRFRIRQNPQKLTPVPTGDDVTAPHDPSIPGRPSAH